MISFTYFFSLLFNSYGSAQVWIFLCYILGGTVLATLMFVLRIFEDTNPDAVLSNYFLKLLPPFLFGSSIIDISGVDSYANVENRP